MSDFYKLKADGPSGVYDFDTLRGKVCVASSYSGEITQPWKLDRVDCQRCNWMVRVQFVVVYSTETVYQVALQLTTKVQILFLATTPNPERWAVNS